MTTAAASNSYIVRLRPLRPPRVCVAVIGDDAQELVEKAEALARDNSFLEFRLDYLSKPALALPKLKEFVEYHPHIMTIATCRRAANGGKFHGSVVSQLDILGKAADLGCQLVDMELQSASQCKPDQLKKLRARAALVLSYHDFRATKKLEETLAKMTAIPADFYKIVSTATTLYDNVVMMKFLEKHSDQHSLIGLCMGEQGIISRVLGVRAGSVFTFAAVSEDQKTAPGQVTAQDLRSTYRIEQVDAATRVYGVAGDPVAHSLSPLVMNAALRRETVNGVYLSLHAKTLKDLLACIRDIPIHGVSVTMPYKESIVSHLDNSDSATTKTGRLQYGGSGAGWQALRLQYRYGGGGTAAGTENHDRECKDPGAGCRGGGTRCSFRLKGARGRGLYPESDSGAGAKAGSPSQGPHAEAARSEETCV